MLERGLMSHPFCHPCYRQVVRRNPLDHAVTYRESRIGTTQGRSGGEEAVARDGRAADMRERVRACIHITVPGGVNAIHGAPECWEEVSAGATSIERIDVLDRGLSVYVVEPGSRCFYVEDGGG